MFEQGEAVEFHICALAKVEVCQRPDQHGLCAYAESQRLFEFLERFGRTEPENSLRLKFRDDVMVVRIEPLRHLTRMHRVLPRATEGRTMSAWTACPPGDLKAQFQTDSISIPLEARRDVSKQTNHIEHLVVEGEIVRGNQ